MYRRRRERGAPLRYETVISPRMIVPPQGAGTGISSDAPAARRFRRSAERTSGRLCPVALRQRAPGSSREWEPLRAGGAQPEPSPSRCCWANGPSVSSFSFSLTIYVLTWRASFWSCARQGVREAGDVQLKREGFIISTGVQLSATGCKRAW